MASPSKVTAFLDITGDWDPSLILVMISAIAVHGVSYFFIVKRRRPILAVHFQIPTRRDIDSKLVTGAVIFGMGWGLAGFCPGPAIVASATLNPSVLLFLAGMIGGIYAYTLIYQKIFGK